MSQYFRELSRDTQTAITLLEEALYHTKGVKARLDMGSPVFNINDTVQQASIYTEQADLKIQQISKVLSKLPQELSTNV